MHGRTSVLAALPPPRHGESAAADLGASHTGLCIPVLAIEGVRAHASAISTGALAVFRACRRSPASLDRSRRRGCLSASGVRGDPIALSNRSLRSKTALWRAPGWLPAGAWLSGLDLAHES